MLMQYEIPQCAICFDELTKDLSVTKCGHVYHRKCIEMAVELNPLCPLDRVVNDKASLRNLQYSLIVREDTDTARFFNEMPEDEKKSLKRLSHKLQAVL